MMGEVFLGEFGTMVDRASTLHLPLYGGGREGGRVSQSAKTSPSA